MRSMMPVPFYSRDAQAILNHCDNISWLSQWLEGLEAHNGFSELILGKLRPVLTNTMGVALVEPWQVLKQTYTTLRGMLAPSAQVLALSEADTNAFQEAAAKLEQCTLGGLEVQRCQFVIRWIRLAIRWAKLEPCKRNAKNSADLISKDVIDLWNDLNVRCTQDWQPFVEGLNREQLSANWDYVVGEMLELADQMASLCNNVLRDFDLANKSLAQTLENLIPPTSMSSNPRLLQDEDAYKAFTGAVTTLQEDASYTESAEVCAVMKSVDPKALASLRGVARLRRVRHRARCAVALEWVVTKIKVLMPSDPEKVKEFGMGISTKLTQKGFAMADFPPYIGKVVEKLSHFQVAQPSPAKASTGPA